MYYVYLIELFGMNYYVVNGHSSQPVQKLLFGTLDVV